MKSCETCKKDKPLVDYNRNRSKPDGYGTKCRECMRIYRKDHYQRNRQHCIDKSGKRKRKIKNWLDNYKTSVSCVKCGEPHIATIDFHHESDKEFNISEAVQRGYGIPKIKTELNKCVVLCSNCHRILHWNEKQAGIV